MGHMGFCGGGGLIRGIIGVGLSSLAFCGGVEFSGRFAPHQGIVTAYEQPQRQEVCLNGTWQFQPVDLPRGYEWDRGDVPPLAEPGAEKWHATPIKIPSAWNVNNWGLWGDPGTYDPVPLYYPSYPESWKHVSMGWLRKTFRVPGAWKGRRVVLRFEGVAGECRVLVNGKTAVASHYGTFTPFEADITEFVEGGADNELLVGVRSHRLFQIEHPVHKWGWRAMGPTGSDMYTLCGIYQDVYLLGLPEVYAEDVFVKPWVDKGDLEIDVTVRNTSGTAQSLRVGGQVRPWKTLAGSDVLSAPEQNWTLLEPVMSISGRTLRLLPGETKTVTLRESVDERLKTWSPRQPNLYAALIDVQADGALLDRKYTRFGWRQFVLKDGDVFLNGERIRLYGDILHPFSSFIMTRRTAWAWYTMIGDFGGNAVRPHAQPWPKYYIDMADEMGIIVLDEMGLFGSSGGFNMDQEQAWQNCRDEYHALIVRDRNSPAVMGWSFANEMFALGLLNKIPDAEFEPYRERLAEFGKIATQLDPTRQWISCDGDEDLGGRLSVWSKHWGDGWKDKQKTDYALPQDGSTPRMLGEYSGSYYGLPNRLDYLNGDRAYESYAGRAEALGIDVYEVATGLARDTLDYFSASETVWFGLEHLNFGYDDFSRLPTECDGVFFTRAYREGEPGMQPERLPPYVATLNPGWDAKLPLYKPLAMFDAMKAALAPGQPLPFSGRVPFRTRPDVPKPTVRAVAFVGAADGGVSSLLKKHHVSVVDDAAAAFVIVDAHTGLNSSGLKERLAETLSRGGTVLIMVGDLQTDIDALNRVLPKPVALTDRQASSFVHGTENAMTAPLSLRELFFVENERTPHVMRCGLDGPLVSDSTILLEACGIDWSLFNASENRKCAALTLYEKLHKPSGAALVQWSNGRGRLLLCTIGVSRDSRPISAFWGKLFACLGVDTAGALRPQGESETEKRAHDLLRDGPVK